MHKILEKCCFNENKNLNLISNIIKKSNEKLIAIQKKYLVYQEV